MVVGDAVNGISALNTVLDFQPAVGVEVVIGLCGFDGNPGQPEFFDGVLQSGIIADGTINRDFNITNMKMFVTNVNYLRLPALGVGLSTSFAGIETQ